MYSYTGCEQAVEVQKKLRQILQHASPAYFRGYEFIVLQMEGKSSTFTVALYLESELVPRNGYEVVKRIEPFTYF